MKPDRHWEGLKAQNLNLWEQKHDLRGALQRGADAPLLAIKPQKPCDIGLFSDDRDQLDLCEMFHDPTTRG